MQAIQTYLTHEMHSALLLLQSFDSLNSPQSLVGRAPARIRRKRRLAKALRRGCEGAPRCYCCCCFSQEHALARSLADDLRNLVLLELELLTGLQAACASPTRSCGRSDLPSPFLPALCSLPHFQTADTLHQASQHLAAS